MQSNTKTCQPIVWKEGTLWLLDQRKLPLQETWLSYDDPKAITEAIREMVVRGAPAIGVTAAYAVVLAARQAWEHAGKGWKQAMQTSLNTLAQARPTAVNLRWAIQQMTDFYQALEDASSPEKALLKQAKAVHQRDIDNNHRMGVLGAELLAPGCQILTHCNAGALATGGFGTALGVVRQGYVDGKIEHVFVDETRPWLQGARLTAWELMQEKIPCTLHSDGVAAALMASGKINWVIVGADRIAANGDVANKIGTYSLAVLAHYHQIKMMVVAPTSTIDWQMKTGEGIPIEQRPACEVTHLGDKQLAPTGVRVLNPAFDVTPAGLIDAIVTEAGVVLSPSAITMKNLIKS